jgi:hypothetical protein
MKSPVELISWKAAAEMLVPGNPPHRKTLRRWFAQEPVSPVVHLSSRKSAVDAAILRKFIERRVAQKGKRT